MHHACPLEAVHLEAEKHVLVIGDVTQAMGNVAGVQEVHDLHLWSICSGYPALSAHVLVADAACETTTAQLASLKQTPAERFSMWCVR